MTLSVVECGDQHLPAVRAFFSRVYRPDYVFARDPDMLRWQFGGVAPGLGRYHIKLAVVDESIVGCLGYIPVDVTISGQMLRGAWTANWVVDPSSRHLALGPRLMSDLVRQHDVTLVVGASAHAQLILPRLGFAHFGELHRYLYVVDRPAVAALTGSDESAWPSPTAAILSRAASDVRGPLPGFDERVERVWTAVWEAEGAGTRRSTEFLNWRYASHPRFQYRLFVSGSRQRPTGFAVYRVEALTAPSIRIGRLVEFVAEPSAEDELLDAVFHDAAGQRLALLDYFCASTRPGAALLRHGWLPAPSAPAAVPVLFQPISQERHAIPFFAHVQKAAGPHDLERWYVTKGDGDQDRPN